MDALNYEIRNSKRRVASATVSRLRTFDYKDIRFSFEEPADCVFTQFPETRDFGNRIVLGRILRTPSLAYSR